MIEFDTRLQIVVYGLGSSGRSCLKFLINNGFSNVYATDDNFQVIEECGNSFVSDSICDSAIANNIFINSSELESLLDRDAYIVFAPGIPLYFPKKHEILDFLETKDVNIVCDIELFNLIFKSKIGSDSVVNIGVTGTNGKSTICAILDFALNGCDIKSYLVGNFGIPIFDIAQDFVCDTFVQKVAIVNEVSSFQLDLLHSNIFDISLISNITQDHILRHGSFENYVDSKLKIAELTSESGVVIFNNDDSILYENYEYFKNSSEIDVARFSRSKLVENGVSFDKDGHVNFNLINFNLSLDCSSLKIVGNHNIENFLAACCIIYFICNKFNLDAKDVSKIATSALEFRGLEHRMQIVSKKSGVLFVNDSKATNPFSAINALETFSEVFWIVGGDDKGCDFDILGKSVACVVKAYVIGEKYDVIEKFLKKKDVKYEICFNLDSAVEKSFAEASSYEANNPVILLSPACASFDQWKDYIERGRYFCKKVNEM